MSGKTDPNGELEYAEIMRPRLIEEAARMDAILEEREHEGEDVPLEEEAEPEPVPYTVTDDDKEYIRTYVAEVDDLAIKRARRKECAQVFGLTLPQVAAITAHTVIRKNRAIAAGPVVLEDQPGLSPVVVMPAGTAMDYDNPIKQKYRGVLKLSLERCHPTREERRHKKVLCLPGRKLLEAHVYLDLGYSKENIVCVEGESTAFGEFYQYASPLGVSLRTCDLGNVVDEQEWDVVNMDFCGPIHQKVLDYLNKLRLNKRGKVFLGLCLLGQRENPAAQQILDHYYATMQASTVIANQPNFIEALCAQEELRAAHRLMKAAGEKMVTDDVDLSVQRDAAIPLAVFHQTGREYQPMNRVSPAPNLRPEYRSQEYVQPLISYFCKMLWREFNYLGMPLEEAINNAHKILSIYDIAMAPKHICTDCEQWSYISPSHQKYLADFYHMEFIRPFGVACDEIINFVNESIVALCESVLQPVRPKDGWILQVRSRNGGVYSTPGRGFRLKPSDTFEFVVDGHVVSRLNYRTLQSGIDRLANVICKDIVIRATHGTYKYERKSL